MPFVLTAPYDDATYVMNLARSICNDAGLTIAGNILSDTQPYSVVLLNSAYRTLQEDLTDNGVETMAQEAIMVGVLKSAVPTDPGVYVSISYTGYNDGMTNYATPTLPVDMIGPLRLEERLTGSIQQFRPMYPTNDGLPSRAAGSWLSEWEWRADAIWMPGATQSNDIRLRYNVYLPELTLAPPPASTVMILRSDRALAYQVSKMFAEARGSQLAASFEQSYQSHLLKIVERTARRKQRGQHRRIPYSRRSSMGWGT